MKIQLMTAVFNLTLLSFTICLFICLFNSFYLFLKKLLEIVFSFFLLIIGIPILLIIFSIICILYGWFEIWIVSLIYSPIGEFLNGIYLDFHDIYEHGVCKPHVIYNFLARIFTFLAKLGFKIKTCDFNETIIVLSVKLIFIGFLGFLTQLFVLRRAGINIIRMYKLKQPLSIALKKNLITDVHAKSMVGLIQNGSMKTETVKSRISFETKPPVESKDVAETIFWIIAIIISIIVGSDLNNPKYWILMIFYCIMYAKIYAG